jgi:hypothetical protein
MWIETRTGPGARTANAVGAHGEVVEPLSVVSTSVLPPSAPEPVPAPVAELPAYVLSGGVRHVPIDVLPWDVVTLRTVCGLDVPHEHGSGESSACEWCGRFGSVAGPGSR